MPFYPVFDQIAIFDASIIVSQPDCKGFSLYRW